MTAVADIVRFKRRVTPSPVPKKPRFEPGDPGYASLQTVRLLFSRTTTLELLQTAVTLFLLLSLLFLWPTSTERPRLLIPALTLFLSLLLAAKWSSALSNKVARLDLQRAHLHALLAHFATDVLDGATGCRVTWFRPHSTSPSYRDNYVAPFARYDPITPDPRPRSRAYYPFGISYTGFAATQPNKVIICEFPLFADRLEMEAHYRERLLIPDHFLARISNYMVKARTIVSYAVELRFPERVFLGVLSIDLLQTPRALNLPDKLARTEFRVLLTAIADLEAAGHYGRI